MELLFFRKTAHNLQEIDQNPKSFKEYPILTKSLRKESFESRHQLKRISKIPIYICFPKDTGEHPKLYGSL